MSKETVRLMMTQTGKKLVSTNDTNLTLIPEMYNYHPKLDMFPAINENKYTRLLYEENNNFFSDNFILLACSIIRVGRLKDIAYILKGLKVSTNNSFIMDIDINSSSSLNKLKSRLEKYVKIGFLAKATAYERINNDNFDPFCVSDHELDKFKKVLIYVANSDAYAYLNMVMETFNIVPIKYCWFKRTPFMIVDLAVSFSASREIHNLMMHTDREVTPLKGTMKAMISKAMSYLNTEVLVTPKINKSEYDKEYYVTWFSIFNVIDEFTKTTEKSYERNAFEKIMRIRDYIVLNERHVEPDIHYNKRGMHSEARVICVFKDFKNLVDFVDLLKNSEKIKNYWEGPTDLLSRIYFISEPMIIKNDHVENQYIKIRLGEKVALSEDREIVGDICKIVDGLNINF